MGDLRKLERDLDSYVRRFLFNYITIKKANQTARAETPSREVREPEALALRGELDLARGRLQTARPLLEETVERAPDLARAQASLGRLELREGKREEARREVARAVELDSTNFLIHYLHAIMNLVPGGTRESMAGVEQSLERSTALNHDFAPPTLCWPRSRLTAAETTRGPWVSRAERWPSRPGSSTIDCPWLVSWRRRASATRRSSRAAAPSSCALGGGPAGRAGLPGHPRDARASSGRDRAPGPNGVGRARRRWRCSSPERQ